jgi:hypothetical protein
MRNWELQLYFNFQKGPGASIIFFSIFEGNRVAGNGESFGLAIK